jgi:hypothetical protein
MMQMGSHYFGWIGTRQTLYRLGGLSNLLIYDTGMTKLEIVRKLQLEQLEAGASDERVKDKAT